MIRPNSLCLLFVANFIKCSWPENISKESPDQGQSKQAIRYVHTKSFPGGGMSQNRTQSQHYLEKENDQMAEDMRTKVSALKQITLQISDEVRQQNKMLGQLDEDFDSGHNMLGATMRRLGLISKSGGYRFMCYLIIFSLFVFLIMWYMIR